LQRDALLQAGILPEHLYEDFTSGKSDDRQGLMACLKALRKDDTLIVWKLDRLVVIYVAWAIPCMSYPARGISFKVLTGQGAQIDTTTSQGKLVLGIFAALAKFERGLISERTRAGLASARARGRKGGAPFKMAPAKLQLAVAS
jgi:DNA invertase Pin-like site-specific DNA recombinase